MIGSDSRFGQIGGRPSFGGLLKEKPQPKPKNWKPIKIGRQSGGRGWHPAGLPSLALPLKTSTRRRARLGGASQAGAPTPVAPRAAIKLRQRREGTNALIEMARVFLVGLSLN
jgi:hypothetical protein